MKKIAAIHDLSGYGRASLTVAIPILSYMGYQVCPLPTAILSAHSEYKDFRSFDLTDQSGRGSSIIGKNWTYISMLCIRVIWHRKNK